MGTYVNHAEQLRNDVTTHYNCAQSVLVAFADKMGYTHDQAFALGAHLGGGARHGSICGALSGALIVLGALGYSDSEARGLITAFQARYGDTDCRALLRTAAERGEPKNDHCNNLVMAMAAAVEELVES